MTWRRSDCAGQTIAVLEDVAAYNEKMTPKSSFIAMGAVLLCVLCGCIGAPAGPGAVAQEADPGSAATPGSRCSSYADCPHGMICAGAGGGATGTCMPQSRLPRPRIAHDVLPGGYLGSIYGHPIVQGEPPAGAPASDKGGVWDMKTGTYRPPRGGKWIYRPGGTNGFAGVWVYLP